MTRDRDDWWTLGKCSTDDVDPAVFFPKGGPDPWAKPRHICSGCPVADECLEDALSWEWGSGRDTRFGMSGGHSPVERFEIEACRVELGLGPKNPEAATLRSGMGVEL